MIFCFGIHEEEAIRKFKLECFGNKCNSLAMAFEDHAKDWWVTTTAQNMALRFLVMRAKWTKGGRRGGGGHKRGLNVAREGVHSNF